jgi:YHS domain-containing protein
MKKVICLSLIGVAVLWITNSASAMMMCGSGQHSKHQQMAKAEPAEHQDGEEGAAGQPASAESVDIGNKICPVSGEKIDEETKTTYEYEGKIYNFCCAGCIDEFKKDPEKYIKKVDEELKK